MSKRRASTFSQREGYEEPPGPLRLEELPPQARTRIWNELYEFQSDTHSWLDMQSQALKGLDYTPRFLRVMRDVHGQLHGKPLDEWTGEKRGVQADLKNRIANDSFHRVFDLIEFIMRHEWCPPNFVERMARVFRGCKLAYRIDPGPPAKIFPAVTPEEGEELLRNTKELRDAGLKGASAHLQEASQCINRRKWADSVRESIHAVESVARQIDPDASKTLGPALNSLERQGVLQHPALKEAFSKLYGYTCDEEGIRHARVYKPEAEVTVDEALFFLGACASFASYLWRKHQAAAPT